MCWVAPLERERKRPVSFNRQPDAAFGLRTMERFTPIQTHQGNVRRAVRRLDLDELLEFIDRRPKASLMLRAAHPERLIGTEDRFAVSNRVIVR